MTATLSGVAERKPEWYVLAVPTGRGRASERYSARPHPYPEDAEYARRLKTAGVACQVHVEPGMYHAADVFLDGKAPSMTRFRGETVRVLASALR